MKKSPRRLSLRLKIENVSHKATKTTSVYNQLRFLSGLCGLVGDQLSPFGENQFFF